ncbi:hypothetical protein VTH06DRAFT_6874 [Thermothelomyces fergusii]
MIRDALEAFPAGREPAVLPTNTDFVGEENNTPARPCRETFQLGLPKMARRWPGYNVVRPPPCLRPWLVCRYGATSAHRPGSVWLAPDPCPPTKSSTPSRKVCPLQHAREPL